KLERLAEAPAAEDHRGVLFDDHREAELAAAALELQREGVRVEFGADGAVDGHYQAWRQTIRVSGGPLGGFGVEVGQTLARRPHRRPHFVLVGHGKSRESQYTGI